jgi:hypothetical protein
MFVTVLMPMLVMMVVTVVFVRVLRFCGVVGRGIFEGISRTQLCAFQARPAPKKLPGPLGSIEAPRGFRIP